MGCLWEVKKRPTKKCHKPPSTPSVRRHEGQSTAEQAHQSCHPPPGLSNSIQVYPNNQPVVHHVMCKLCHLGSSEIATQNVLHRFFHFLVFDSVKRSKTVVMFVQLLSCFLLVLMVFFPSYLLLQQLFNPHLDCAKRSRGHPQFFIGDRWIRCQLGTVTGTNGTNGTNGCQWMPMDANGCQLTM